MLSDIFTPDSVASLMLIMGVVALVAMAGIALASVWRQRQLSRLDPPTAAELDAVRALRLPGRFRLAGRSSAVARHFEHSGPPNQEPGGTMGCYEPEFVDTWRDRRTDG